MYLNLSLVPKVSVQTKSMIPLGEDLSRTSDHWPKLTLRFVRSNTESFLVCATSTGMQAECIYVYNIMGGGGLMIIRYQVRLQDSRLSSDLKALQLYCPKCGKGITNSLRVL